MPLRGKLRELRSRVFCPVRRRGVRSLRSPLALGLIAFSIVPQALQSCGGPNPQGDTFLSIGCAPISGGLQYRAVVTGFRVKIGFRYHFWISRNGVQVVSGDDAGHYYTDSNGSHFGYPTHYYPPTCKCTIDDYNVQAVAISDDGNWTTSYANQSVSCAG